MVHVACQHRIGFGKFLSASPTLEGSSTESEPNVIFVLSSYCRGSQNQSHCSSRQYPHGCNPQYSFVLDGTRDARAKLFILRRITPQSRSETPPAACVENDAAWPPTTYTVRSQAAHKRATAFTTSESLFTLDTIWRRVCSPFPTTYSSCFPTSSTTLRTTPTSQAPAGHCEHALRRQAQRLSSASQRRKIGSFSAQRLTSSSPRQHESWVTGPDDPSPTSGNSQPRSKTVSTL